MGLTTKLSVVSARPAPSMVTMPASPIDSSVPEPNAGTNNPSIRVWVALPPAPCAIVICASLNFGRLDRAVSMMSRIRCSRPLTALSDGAHTTSRSRAKRP